MKLKTYLLWGSYSAFLFLYFHLFKNTLIDDAFITLQYVKTLLASGTWGFFPGYTANSATSPLNVLLLSAISVVTGPTVEAVMVLSTLCFLLMAICLTDISRQLTRTVAFGWLAVCALLFNPLLISTLGLESIIFITLFVISIYAYRAQRWNLLALSLGLLTLSRADGVLFSLVFLVFLPTVKIKLRVVCLFVLCILPWYVFSWIHLGSFIPDTFFIKTDQRTWLTWDYFNGIPSLYYHVYPEETILSFIFLPLILLLLNRGTKSMPILQIIGLAGLLHFIGYSLLRVPPFHWYYVPQVAAIILLGSLGLGVLYRKADPLRRQQFLIPVTALCFLIPVLGMAHILAKDHFAVREMPIHSNWATYEQYKEIGQWLKQDHSGEPIRLAASEIGTLSYYCDCYLLDRFSDRSWLHEYIGKLESKPGIMLFFYRLNFTFYSPARYPPASHILQAYSSEVPDNIAPLKKWDISTKWIGHAVIIFGNQ